MEDRDVQNQIAAARVYLESGRPQKAEEILTRVLEASHDHFEAKLLMVYAYRDQGRISQGIELSRSLVGKGDDGAVYAIMADCYYARIQVPEAIKYYSKALESNPLNVDWLAQLILLHYENEEEEKALEVMDRAARLNPLHYLLWHNIYLFFYRTESNTVMENQALSKLADMEIQVNQYHLYQAMTAEKEGRLESAYELYKKAFLVDPANQDMKWHLTNFEEKHKLNRG